MNETCKSRVWVEVNLTTLKDNFHAIAHHVAPLKVTAVLKANAYGLGVVPIAEAVNSAGVDGFAVAEIREALPLLHFKKPIQVLGALLPEEWPIALAHGIHIPIGDAETAKEVSKLALKMGVTAQCQIPVDTGMGRLGVLFSQGETFLDEVCKLPNIHWIGAYSHFPIAYKSAFDLSSQQVLRLRAFAQYATQCGIQFERLHIANSDAINNLPFTYAAPFTHVRTGINLHGSFDPEGRRALKLNSILTLKTRLVAIRDLPAHYSIGYGCTYTLPKDTRVGVISAGYADGMPLALSNRGYVLINNIQCPILGRISMDYTTIDLTQIPDVALGTEVILLGGEGLTKISVEDWANLKNTHSYDIICSFGNRVERVYVQ